MGFTSNPPLIEQPPGTSPAGTPVAIYTVPPAGMAPGGVSTQLQYNNAGNFAGAAGATYDGANLNLANAPTAPTAPTGTNTTQIATTAFVLSNGGGSPATVLPVMDSAAAIGTSPLYARQDHVHPSDTSRAATANNLSDLTDKAAAIRNLGGLDLSAVVSVTGTTTLTTSAFGKLHVISGTAASYTVTLPTPVGNIGNIIAFQIDQPAAASKLYTLSPAAGNINDQPTLVMWAKETAVLRSDGANWIIIEGRPVPMSGRIAVIVDQTVPASTLTELIFSTGTQDLSGLNLCLDTVNGRFLSPRRSSWTFCLYIQYTQTGAPTFMQAVLSAGATTIGSLYNPNGPLTGGELLLNGKWSGAAGTQIHAKIIGNGTVVKATGSAGQLVVLDYVEAPQW